MILGHLTLGLRKKAPLEFIAVAAPGAILRERGPVYLDRPHLVDRVHIVVADHEPLGAGRLLPPSLVVHLHVAVDADVAQVDDRVAGADQLVPGVHHRRSISCGVWNGRSKAAIDPCLPGAGEGIGIHPKQVRAAPANQVSPSRPTTLIGLPRRPIERIHVRSGRRSRSRSRTGARSGATKRLRTASRRGRFTASRAEVPIRWTIRGKILRPGGCVPNALPNLWRSHWSAAAV